MTFWLMVNLNKLVLSLKIGISYPPEKIKDPSVSKPADWVDEARIADPTATKPDGYDAIPKEITDPNAKKPEDWDEDFDGEWEAPQIPNPEYKGEWKAPMIDNPAYKGEWVHPEIDNPDFVEDKNIISYDHEYIGFEIWQVKAGSIFDHILVTDDVAEAQAFADGYFKQQQDAEKKGKEAADAVERERAEKERAAAETEAANAGDDAAAADADADQDDDDNEKDDDDNEKAHDEL